MNEVLRRNHTITAVDDTLDKALRSSGIRKIVFCHLESLCGLPALNHLFALFGDRVGLVLSSRRFGSKHGGALHQFVTSVRRSGLRMTLWLGFDIVSVQVLSRVARLMSIFGARRSSQLMTLSELGKRHGAHLLETDDINADVTQAAVQRYAPDLIVVMNFDQILRPPFVAIPRLCVINVHPSLLPSLRGPCPAFWALAERREISGVSLHLIEDEKIDAGRVLIRHEMAIDRCQSVAEVTTALFLAGARALPEALSSLAVDRNVGLRQDLSEGQYRGFPSRDDMAASHRVGVRLCGFGHVVRLVRATLTGHSWRDNDHH